MRRTFASTGALLFAFLALANPARADYVLFLRSFGEWTVICALDEPTQRKRCRLSAPAPMLTSPAAGARVRIDLVTDTRGAPQLEARIQHVVDTNRPLSLRIDDAPAYEVLPPRTGEVAWGGGTAAAIIAEMAKGRPWRFGFSNPAAASPGNGFLRSPISPKRWRPFAKPSVISRAPGNDDRDNTWTRRTGDVVGFRPIY